MYLTKCLPVQWRGYVTAKTIHESPSRHDRSKPSGAENALAPSALYVRG